ncbi:hypothetical protein KCU88_g4574, partial [Aureobasidium melanogenum]
MPKPTHSASASPARKTARRRVRRQRSRARRLNRQRASGPSNRRPVKRRKLRDQASLDLGECLYECQERGYHMDSDVRLGRGVFSTGNQYPLLDLDVSDPEPSIEGPSPDLPHSPQSLTALMHPASYYCPSSPEVGTQRAVLKPKKPHNFKEITQSPSSLFPMSFGHGGSDDGFRVKFPDELADPPVEEQPRQYRIGFLDNIHIPSPTLYRSLSQGMPSSSIEKEFPFFEFAYGQPRPEPDFTSYRTLGDPERLLEAGLLTGPAVSTSFKSSLPLTNRTSLTQRAAFSPGQAADNSANDGGSEQTPGQTLTDQFPMPGRYPSISDEIPRPKSPHPNAISNISWFYDAKDDSLIFPMLWSSGSLQDVVSSNRSSNNTVETGANSAASADDHDAMCRIPVFDMLPTSLQPCYASGRRPSTLDLDDCVKCKPCETVSLSLSPDSYAPSGRADTSKDIVQVTLHRHPFTGWSFAHCGVDNGTDEPRTSQRTVDSQVGGTENDLKMVEWVKGLGFPAEPSNSNGSVSSDDIPQPRLKSATAPSTSPAREANPTMPGQGPEMAAPRGPDDKQAGVDAAEDEGYYTANEHDTDLEIVTGYQSEDEWAEWDWDWKSESGEEEADSRIGLYATDWE